MHSVLRRIRRRHLVLLVPIAVLLIAGYAYWPRAPLEVHLWGVMTPLEDSADANADYHCTLRLWASTTGGRPRAHARWLNGQMERHEDNWRGAASDYHAEALDKWEVTDFWKPDRVRRGEGRATGWQFWGAYPFSITYTFRYQSSESDEVRSVTFRRDCKTPARELRSTVRDDTMMVDTAWTIQPD